MLKQTTALVSGLALFAFANVAQADSHIHTDDTHAEAATDEHGAAQMDEHADDMAADMPDEHGDEPAANDAHDSTAEMADEHATEDSHEAAPMADAPAEMPAETEMTGHITAQSVVATYNGTPITLGQMIITASQLPPQYQQLPPDVLFTGVLDQLIQQQALADTVGHDPLRVTIALENERRALLAGEAVDAIMQAAVNDDAVASAYASAFASAAPVIEYNASHVLVATQEEAMAVIHRLDAGEAFADLARELSSDPGSGTNGGNLGWFAAGMMVEPFQNAVSMLDVGAVSVPIETQFGWHVIMLDDTREQQPPALDEIRGEIISQLQQDALEQHLADLTEAAQIIRPEPGAFDPALLSDLTLLQE